MAHHYRYIERLEPRTKPSYMDLGHVVHELLEYNAKGLDWEARLVEIDEEKASLFDMEKEYYGDITSHARNIVRRYLKRYKDEPLKYLLVEPDYIVPFVNVIFREKANLQINLVVKPDGLVEDVDGDRWILERKTVKSKFPDIERRVFDLQTSLYIWGLEQVGYGDVRGVLWDEVRAKKPRVPEKTRNGISRRKNIDSDWPTYLRAIKKNGLDPKDYADMKAILTADSDKFFRRVPLRTKPDVVHAIVNEAKSTAIQIARNDPPVMELGFGCHSCLYNRICRTRLMDGDVNFVKKTEFKKKEKRNAQEAKA